MTSIRSGFIMSKRFQFLIEEDELHEIQRAARRERLTVGEWVRQALREVRQLRAQAILERKLAAIRKASEYAAPTADLYQMLAEIESRDQGWNPAGIERTTT